MAEHAHKDSLWNRNYIRVMIANFAIYFSFYLVTPLLPIYLSDSFNATKDSIGLVLSGYTLASLLFRPVSGYLLDSFNRKKLLLICLFFYFLCFGGYLLATSLLVFAFFRTIHGAPFGASTVANNTVAIDVLPQDRRDEGIGYYGLSNNFATAIAPSVGLFIYHHYHNFNLLFILSFVIAGLGFIVNTKTTISPKECIPNKAPFSLHRLVLTRAWLTGVNVAFFGFCFGVLSSYLAIYGQDKLNITSGTGTFFLLFAIGLIISRITGVHGLKQGLITRNIAEGVIASSFGYLLFISVTHPIAYYLSALIIGLGNGHMYPGFQNMMIHMAHPNERGTATSTMLTSWDVGQGLGILIGGIISEHMGYSFAFWSIAILHILGSILFFAFTRKFYLKFKLS